MKRLVWAALAVVVALAAAVLVAPRVVESRANRVQATLNGAPSADASGLHQRLLVADLHCDALLWGRDLLQRSRIGHVDLPRLIEGNVALQAFTVVTTAPRNLNIERNADTSDLVRYLAVVERWPPRTWNSPKQRALFQAAQLRKYAEASNGKLRLIRSRSDLQRFLADRNSGSHIVGAFLGAEGAQSLEGKLENLDDLFAAGFRMMAPTHFTDTAVGGSAAGIGKGGLTPLGQAWVRRMEAKGMVIDLAHASAATLRDVTAMAAKPVLVSHTGVKGTCNNNRNLSDEQLRAVAATGGVIGIGYWDTATCGRDVQSIARAIRHASNVVGAEHVALGSDFDGAVTEPFDTTGLPLVTGALLKEGFSAHEIRLIMGENVLRVLAQTLPQ